MFYKKLYKIEIKSEFNNHEMSKFVMASLSDYISSFVSNNDAIETEIQTFPRGYRLVYRIAFSRRTIFKNKEKFKYMKELTKISNWIYSDENINSLISYMCNITKIR